MNVNKSNVTPPEELVHFGQKTVDDPTQVVDSELLIRRCLESDQKKGYELLFKRYYQPLLSHAVRFVYSKEVAEDLVMEVFSQFWQKNLHLAISTSYRAYLFTTVRHAAYAHLRSEFGREKTSEYPVEASFLNAPNTPQQLLQFSELSVRIEEIIRSTPPQSQKVFVMSRFEGKKNPMIAEELNLSTKTVEGHITKVLSVLRMGLRNYGLLSSLLLSTMSVHGQAFFAVLSSFIFLTFTHL